MTAGPHGFKPEDALFRREALEAHLSERGGRDILRISPLWSWVVVLTVAVLAAWALAFAFLGRVEVTERGPGILRPQGGVRLLAVPVPGVVVDVCARTGDHVRAGDPILRVDSPRLQGAVLEADRALSAHGRDFSGVARTQAILFEQQLRTAQERIRKLALELASHQRVRDRSSSRLAAHQELHRLGILSRLGLQEHEDQFENAQRTVAACEVQLDLARQDLAALRVQRRQEVWQQGKELSLARARRQALDFTPSSVLAPVGGIVDGLVLRIGDQVQTGGLAAKVIPVGTPLVVIAFLKEKDRAFVREGDGVILELAQYPHAEFGTLRGRVVRVGTDLASAGEVREAFGPAEGRAAVPAFKVEIQPEAPPDGRITLRPGMILDARFTLRRQRLATLVLDPLRRWLR
jgi:multidrug resistance efflux pump